MGRAPCCDKANVKRGPWSPEEDAKLKAYIEQHGTGGNWIALPQKIGLKRCGKSCRLRWLNYLRPNIKHGGFSEEEDNIICSLYISIGSRWSIIAAQLPGRTDNDVKNYWNTRLKRKLLGKQRKEPKQEMKNQNENFMISERESQTPYYPEPPVPYPNQDPRLADHASIRKLLIRLGGRFSDDQIQSSSEGTDLRGPFDISNSQLLYQNSINLVSSSSSMNSFTNTSSIANNQYGMDNVFTHHMPQGFSANPFELDEMIHCNTQRLGGFDCLYGKGMVNESNGTNSIESTSWGDTNYEFYQGMVQEGVFGDPKHLASQ